MPSRPKRPCAHVGCGALTDGKYCAAHEQQHAAKQEERRQQYDRSRGSAHSRGYDAQWRKASKAFLRAHPLCAECERQGKLTAATLVDHIVPHQGGARLFWDQSNWQSMCVTCHNCKTAAEDGGFGNRSSH